tara:strand:+ start:800 stop:1138 length:339 start_codon:yes stop_codon:yes gene_type:complete
MPLELTPITEGFGAYASGINLSNILSRENITAIEAGMEEYSVLVWRNSLLEDDQQIRLAENFGAIEVSLLSKVRGKGGPENKSLVPISNVGDDGEMLDYDGRRLGSQIANQF